MINTDDKSTTRYQKYKDSNKAASRRYREKQRILTGRARNCSYEVAFLSAVKCRAKRNGTEFTLTREDIVIPTHCPILGIPIVTNKPGRSDNSPSVDRIDNTKGYHKDNIRIISWRANRIKSDATWQELELIAGYVKNHMDS